MRIPAGDVRGPGVDRRPTAAPAAGGSTSSSSTRATVLANVPVTARTEARGSGGGDEASGRPRRRARCQTTSRSCERNQRDVPDDALTAPEQAIGMETKVALAADAPLPRTALVSPVVVKKGDLVTMIVETRVHAAHRSRARRSKPGAVGSRHQGDESCLEADGGGKGDRAWRRARPALGSAARRRAVVVARRRRCVSRRAGCLEMYLKQAAAQTRCRRLRCRRRRARRRPARSGATT